MSNNTLHESLRQTNQVLLIYTGGTIGMGKNPSTGALEPLDFRHLMMSIPEFQQIQAAVDVHQFDTPIDSSDMNPPMWAELVRIIHKNYSSYDGFVILHGTDTMAYTASALSFMLQNLTKPVILTGSQLPIGQLRTDGKENLITSIELASLRKKYSEESSSGMSCDKGRGGTFSISPIPEVCIYFSGHLLRGNRSTKRNAERFNAFESFNYPHLCEAGVDFTFAEHHILKPDFSRPMIPHYDMCPDVLIFSLFPGLQKEMVQHILDNPKLKAIVMRSYGSGNAPKHQWLTEILKRASERGIIVVNISQCVAGSVMMGRYDSSLHLTEAGVISGYDSTIEAASTKLMHLLAIHKDPQIVREHMQRSLAGEITNLQ